MGPVRKALAGAFVVMTLAGCGAGTDVLRPAVVAPPSVAVSATPSGQAPCVKGVLITVGEVDGAMGLRAVGITVRNCGRDAYTLHGYPALEVLDAGGRRVDVEVRHGTEHVHRIERYDGPPASITLARGEEAGAVLLWRNVTTVAETAVHGEYLRVATGPGRTPQLLALTVDAGNTGAVAVSPWVRE